MALPNMSIDALRTRNEATKAATATPQEQPKTAPKKR
jgi:hypothetical protein